MLKSIQAHLGYHYERESLLEQAITHRSYLNEHANYPIGHNERLEYLGDAVLGMIASDFLYHRFPDMAEGNMTRLRTWLVRTETLAQFARDIGLGNAMRLAKGEIESGGRDRDSILCNGFEALMGALYLDAGLEAVRTYVEPRFEAVAATVLESQKDKDAKSLFQEWSQAMFGITPIYRTIAAVGTEQDREFTVELMIGNVVAGWGSGRNKQTAEQMAARQALDAARLGIMDIPDLEAD